MAVALVASVLVTCRRSYRREPAHREGHREQVADRQGPEEEVGDEQAREEPLARGERLQEGRAPRRRDRPSRSGRRRTAPRARRVPKANAGEKGDTGPIGPQGPAGADGADGGQGPPGGNVIASGFQSLGGGALASGNNDYFAPAFTPGADGVCVVTGQVTVDNQGANANNAVSVQTIRRLDAGRRLGRRLERTMRWPTAIPKARHRRRRPCKSRPAEATNRRACVRCE